MKQKNEFSITWLDIAIGVLGVATIVMIVVAIFH